MQGKQIALAGAVAAALATLAAPAAAQSLEIKLSGQVSRGIMFSDDGVQSDVYHVDNDNSSTRFRFTGAAGLTPDVRAGVNWEMEYQSAPSNVASQVDRVGPAPTLDERILEIFFDSKRFGRLALGQGDGAANGAVEVDLSGTSIAHFSDTPAVGGGIFFRDGANALTAVTIGGVVSNQDFESRYERLRYDTPTFGGFSVALSTGVKNEAAAPVSRDVWEAALRYAGEFGGFGRVAGALGFSHQDGNPGAANDETMGGSLSWLHGSGFNVTAGYTTRDRGTRDSTFTYAKVGYKTGMHAFSVDYAMGDEQAAANDEATSMGLAYVYTPAAWAELFAMFKRVQLDRPGATFQDINVGMIGTRLRF